MNKGFQVGWWLAVITIAAMYSVALPLTFLFPDLNEYVVSIIGETALLLPVAIGIFYAKRNGVTPADALGIKKFNPMILPGAVLLTLGAQYFITYATMPVQTVLIIMFGSETATSQIMIPQNTGEFIIAFTALCIAAPVFEELLCRGVIMKLFERYGFAVSLISSSLVFTVLHFEARSFIPIFFLGLLFGVFRHCTGSVFLTMILHAVNNFTSLCQLTFVPSDSLGAIGIIITILAVLFPVILYVTFVKSKHYYNFYVLNTKSEKTGFSVAALVLFITFAGFNLLLFLQRLINGECLNEINILLGK